MHGPVPLYFRLMPRPGPIAVVFGTRPEAIKLVPVILALRDAGMPPAVVTTGQHGALVDEVLDLFAIEPDASLGLMRDGQTLDYLLAESLKRVGEALDRLHARMVVVQGDTTSMLGSAIAAFHLRIPVAHVEAGLRSRDLSLPFPEEMNRRVASTVARWHFAPTDAAAANLRCEGITDEIHVVGNTVVDSLRQIVDHPASTLPRSLTDFLGDAPYLLATAHRRESWAGGIAGIATGLGQVLEAMPDHRLIFVTHPNPTARRPVDEALGDLDRAMVLGAVPYAQFIRLLRGAQLVVSDSGGVQEEAPTLGVPVLVTRRITERMEGVAAGAVRIIGTDSNVVRDETLDLLRSPRLLAAMARAGASLYGDGYAAERIVRILAAEQG